MKNLKEHRSDNHFTQEEVAYILQIPRFKVEQIERMALRKLALIQFSKLVDRQHSSMIK